jgi:hypothetical protein
MTNKELIENLLIEYDELDMQPMLIVPDPLDRAKAWKHELMYAIAHLEAEVAREIFEEIEKYWIKSDTLPDCARLVDLDKIAELKKKYTGEQT